MANLYLKSGSGTPGSGTYRGYWQASQTWAVGDRVFPTRAYGTSSAKFYCQECTTGGAGGGTEPTWATIPGNTTADGAATFTCRNPTSWANANIHIDYITQLDASGDFVYVSQNHSESVAGTISCSWAGTSSSPTRVLCVDDTSGEPPTTLTTGAVIETTGANTLTLSSAGVVYFNGLHLKAADGTNNARIDLAGASFMTCENCIFELTGTNASSRIRLGNSLGPITLKNCQYKFGSTSQSLESQTGAVVCHIGDSLASGSAAITRLWNLPSFSNNILLIGCDFSGAATSFNFDSSSAGCLLFKVVDCKLPASWSGSLNGLQNPGMGSIYELQNSDSGDTNYRLERKTYFGVITHETTLVRSGGASDGTTSLSWKMVSGSVAQWSHQTLDTSEIVRWNETTGSSITVTVEILHDSVTALTDKEIWIEVTYLGTSGVPLGSFISDAAANYFASATNQTSSSASWTTTGMSNPNKQKLNVSFTPQEKGFIHATVKIAKASKTVYVDPLLTVS